QARDAKAVARLSYDFHTRIYRLSNNEYLERILTDLLMKSHRYIITFVYDEEDPVGVLEKHGAILEAIQDGDPESMVRAVLLQDTHRVFL
ncbi:MAG: FCD domain-containing protein, partial [Firmicutes bacterium]|nr:FCD domain-containing protein [Bacillota bacterium]